MSDASKKACSTKKVPPHPASQDEALPLVEKNNGLALTLHDGGATITWVELKKMVTRGLDARSTQRHHEEQPCTIGRFQVSKSWPKRVS